MERQGICIFLLISIIFFTISSAAAQPRIEVPEKKYDFGDVKQGDTLEYTFRILNIGTETLVIEKVTSS